jgi:hypothetical protein
VLQLPVLRYRRTRVPLMWLACTTEAPFDCRTVLVSPSSSLFYPVLSRYQP